MLIPRIGYFSYMSFEQFSYCINISQNLSRDNKLNDPPPPPPPPPKKKKKKKIATLQLV